MPDAEWAFFEPFGVASGGKRGRPPRLIAKVDTILACFEKYRTDSPETEDGE